MGIALYRIRSIDAMPRQSLCNFCNRNWGLPAASKKMWVNRKNTNILFVYNALHRHKYLIFFLLCKTHKFHKSYFHPILFASIFNKLRSLSAIVTNDYIPMAAIKRYIACFNLLHLSYARTLVITV